MKVVKSRMVSFLLAVLMVITTVFGHVDYTVAADQSIEGIKLVSFEIDE